MPLAPIKQGNDRIIWGTNGVYTEGIIIEDFDDEPGVEESTIPDNDGFTVAHIMIPDVHEFSFTMVCQSDVALPQTGDPLTIAGQACVCVKCSPKKKRKAEMTAKVTAKHIPEIFVIAFFSYSALEYFLVVHKDYIFTIFEYLL